LVDENGVQAAPPLVPDQPVEGPNPPEESTSPPPSQPQS
jgi:hypothetical protein